MPAGRPVAHTKEIAEEICARLAGGESLRSICKDDHIPAMSSVMRWLFKDGEEFENFREQYAQARQMQAEVMADEILDIADDGANDYVARAKGDGEESYVFNGEHVQRSKLRVDSRKWVASRLLPKKYGDKITQEHTGPNGGPIEFFESLKPTIGPPSERKDTTD